ncbi:SPOR domain-containing protein [Marinobacterium sp. AK62]|uniref:SPOR domain-containing protein n=1 Tax=Marinobacterium alkalitolerans TaxID=1542925 RepID=A0ABS3ZD03_9GAMM|nr:SPOR domain-containing protein [Marinobacterium alkalitolerans]
MSSPVEPPEQQSPESDAPEPAFVAGYYVQLASLRDAGDAERFVVRFEARRPEMLASHRVRVKPFPETGYFKAWMGHFEQRKDAEAACEALQQNGQDCFVIQHP